MKNQLKGEQHTVFIEVEYLENTKMLYSNWIGSYLSVEQVKQGCLLVLDKIKEYKCSYC